MNQVTVLTTPAPEEAIKTFFADATIINDCLIFNMINTGCVVNGVYIKLGQDELISSLETALHSLNSPRILVHTFNPLVLNALEITDDDPPNLTKEFVIYSNEEGFQDVLKHKSILEKTQFMSIGEAIDDTIMSTIVSDFENNKNLIEDLNPDPIQN